MAFLRNNWLAVLVIVFFVWLSFKPSGCGPTPSWAQRHSDTVKLQTVTTYVTQPVQYVPQYTPIVTESKVPVYIPQPYQTQSNGDYDKLLAEYNTLVKRFVTENTYKDSIQLKDSSGKRVGVVNLKDMVSENQIKSREPNYQLSFPQTTTTITLREPPKNQVFLGVGLTGNTATPVNGANAGFLFKTKTDKVLGANAGFQYYNNQFVPQFGISTYWKLSFKK